MTAWTKGLDSAPQSGMVLVRLDTWDCPCVMRREVYDGEPCWIFVEQTLSDMAGGLEPDEAAAAEWAPMPQ